MADDDFDEKETSAGGLRNKLKETLKANAEMAAELAVLKAQNVISAKGLKHVTADDLKGIAASEIEAKAVELEAAKQKDQETVVRKLAADRGLEGADLDSFVAGLLGTSEGDANAAALDRIRSVGSLQGSKPGAKTAEDLHDYDLIAHAYGATK